MTAPSIREQAELEVALEARRSLIEQEKARIRTHRPWFHKLFPFVITITRR